MQQINIKQVTADSQGNVVSKERGLEVETSPAGGTELSGSFDTNSGQLVLNIPTIGKLTVTGFPTIHDVGYGPAGVPGQAGRDGVDGLLGADGLRGSDGCPGARGLPGRVGVQGPDGRRGERGATGATGAPGPRGEPGKVTVWVQETDPRIDNPNIPEGSIWVKI